MTAHSNPMRWKCGQLGCYNVHARPKIEVFADCFPGRICMGDIDGLVEVNGRFLLLEWKHAPEPIPTGQRITYDAFVSLPNHLVTVLCVAGNATTMEVTHAMSYRPGRLWRRASLLACKRFMVLWAEWAVKQQRWRDEITRV